MIRKYDYEVKGGSSLRGQPPDDHPRRCIGKCKTGDRCTQWGLKNTNPPKCRRHFRGKLGKDNLPNFYKNVLGPSLNAVAAEMLELESADQFELLDELALVRIDAQRYVAIYAAAREAHEKHATPETADMLDNASALMQGALRRVAEMAEKAAKIHFSSKNLYTPMDLRVVVQQITNIAYETFGKENKHLAEEFQYNLDSKLKLPAAGNEGTKLTPDQTVREMDATIPCPSKPNVQKS